MAWNIIQQNKEAFQTEKSYAAVSRTTCLTAFLRLTIPFTPGRIKLNGQDQAHITAGTVFFRVLLISGFPASRGSDLFF